MKKVEQINKQGELVLDYDQIVKSKNKIKELILDNLSTLQKNKINLTIEKKYFKIQKDRKTFLIYFKNITYLGNPHPIFKKRMQVKLSEEEIKEYNENKLKIVGIYNYKSNLIFIVPKIKKQKKFNNSSITHVSTIDLLKSLEIEKYKKIGKNKNETLFFNSFFELINYFENEQFEYKNEIFKIIEKFAVEKLEKNKFWIGNKCYEEMEKDSFRNKNQMEWIGFYFEFIFQKFLLENKISPKILEYLKSKKEIFDLWILNSYHGDLKTHSILSNAVLGNDYKQTIKSIEDNGKIWLFLLKHNPTMDKDLNYQLSISRNKILNKNSKSYAEKMKNNATLIKFQILEINKNNWNYTDIFKQGVNSDKKSKREHKYKIKEKNIDNFIIYNKYFEYK